MLELKPPFWTSGNKLDQMLAQIHSFPSYSHRFELPFTENETDVRNMYQALENRLQKEYDIHRYQEDGHWVITVELKSMQEESIAKASRSPSKWETTKAEEICASLKAGDSIDPEKNPCLKWKLPHGTDEIREKSPYMVADLLNEMVEGLKFEGKMDTVYGLGVNDLAVVIVRK